MCSSTFGYDRAVSQQGEQAYRIARGHHMYEGQRDYAQPALIGREVPPHTRTYRAADVSVNLLVLVSFEATRHRIDLSTCVGVGPRRFVCTLCSDPYPPISTPCSSGCRWGFARPCECQVGAYLLWCRLEHIPRLQAMLREGLRQA